MATEEPGHKAMLYFLEVLMNSNGPLTISQLAGRFGSRSFSPEMRSAAGGNESGLKKFLLKYPSLFTVNGNMVSLFDGSKALASGESSSGADSAGSGGGGVAAGASASRPLPDVSVEMEAVQFFQMKLVKKEERWVPIRSLAGHLSQASEAVRECVGPQLEFRKWLLRHPHIFEVQGELVGLRDNLAAMATPAVPTRKYNVVHNGVDPSPSVPRAPPKTPPATRRNIPPKTPPTVRRSKSFSEQRVTGSSGPPPVPNDVSFASPLTPGTSRRHRAPVTMTANEYKAVMFLKDIIEKKGGIRMHNITGHFSQAPEGVRNTIGWTKMELEEFLKKNAAMFHVSEEEVVTLHKNAKMNVIITGSRPQGQSVRTLSGRKGKIFHVAKLWGIIDLGKHEHVFFDKSIMKRPLDDLQKEYKVGETLNFNAVLAPKSSRAKWRAIHVWKEQEEQPSAGETESEFSRAENDESPLLSPAISIEEEINRFLPQRSEVEDLRFLDVSSSNAITIVTGPGDALDSSSNSGSLSNVSAAASETGSPTSQGSPRHLEDNKSNASTSNRHRVSVSVNGNGLPSSPGDNKPKMTTLNIAGNKVLVETAIIDGTAINTVTAKRPAGILKTERQSAVTTCEVACQTISTGEIIATQLYHDSKK